MGGQLSSPQQVTGEDRLSWDQRRFLFVLGLPAFGIALAYTTVTTYVPVLLEQLSGPALVGILIGGEGLLALFVPLLVGGWSDRLRTRLGRRLPFVLGGAALVVPALVLVPLFAGSVLGLAVVLAVFFVGYFVYYAPYYALYPDLVPEDIRGRSQGFQGGLRSGGLLLGLVGGGLLLSLWQPLPFLVGALAVAAATAALVYGIRGKGGQESPSGGDAGGRRRTRSRGGGTGPAAGAWRLVREVSGLRSWMVANSLWEAAISALRTFVVLYLTRGLGLSLTESTGALALVGVAALVAAPVSGTLADRYGPRRVMAVALVVFTIGVTPPLLTANTFFIAAIVPIAFAAVIMITLPYTLLMGLLPEGRGGAGASLFVFSRGVGVLAGPLFAGLAVQAAGTTTLLTFDDTSGYAAMFGVTGLFLLASLPVLRRIPDPLRPSGN